MSLTARYVKKHAKTRQRRRHTAQERLARDRRQAQHAAEALQQALDALELPKDLVTALSQTTENRKVETRKPLIFRDPIFGFYLQNPTLRQSPSTPLRHLPRACA